MTIGDMRRQMLKKVVPESVVPQNIINFLMDENAQLPEPDAYTFLTRLRGLGIGSADFLYLLEGCGAPEAVVEKIRANPAMNLQGLIMTLENSGMTSKDYTRILYTARQIWERTLTLRLETSEAAVTAEDGSEQSYQEGGTDQNDRAEESAQISETVEADEAEEVSAGQTPDVSEEDQLDKEEAPLPHTKTKSPYPDATEELMSVDFGSEYHFGDTTVIDVQKDADLDKPDKPNVNNEAEKDNSSGSFGIGNGGGVGLFGGEAVDGELGYSQSFTESFVNDYMTDFAEDNLSDSSDDEYDFADEFGGTYYGDIEQYTDEIPAVGSGKMPDTPAKKVPEKPSNSIPDAREPFEVHIASYDIPEEPDEFELARREAADREASSPEETPVLSDSNYSDDKDNIAVFEFATEEDLPKKNTAQFVVNIDYGDEEISEPAPENKQYNGDTSMIVPISKEDIEQNISDSASENEADEQAKTAVQKPSSKTAKQKPKREDDDDIYDDYDDFDDFGYGDDDKKKSGWKKGAVIAAGVGAAVLIGANVAVGALINGQKNKNKVAYAENADQIFAEIYYAHADGIAGGGAAAEYQSDYAKVFGDLLICGNGLGAFTAGDCVYNVSDTKIAASGFKNGELTELEQIEPQNGAKFVAAFELGDTLIAVYSGEGECGYLSIKGGAAAYTVRQSGKLTDLKIENGVVGLGSVYTPAFTLPNGEDRFGADNTDVYLPKVGTGYRIISPNDIILSKTKGYSYALSASYSLNGGEVVSSKAALGDPVYASADNLFVMNGSETKKNVTEEYGLLISANTAADDDNEPIYERIGKAGCAAAFGNISAVYEGGTIVVRTLGDKEFNEPSILTPSKAPTTLRFSDSMLTASDNEGIFLTVDCSGTTISKDDLLGLKQINGRCEENSAITLEADTNGIKLTRYVLENGAAKAVVSFTRELTDEQIKTLVCGSANAMAVTDDRVGAAYSYFDGVSVISEYVTLSDSSEAATLFDDKTGFEYAFVSDGKIYAVCSKGSVDVANYSESGDDNSAEDDGSSEQGDDDQTENTPDARS